jgi:hypothetical protein
MVQAIKLVHFLVRSKITTARSIHSSTDRDSLLIGQPVHAAATRFDFACDLGEFFLILFRPGLNLLQQCFYSRAHTVRYSISVQFRHFPTGNVSQRAMVFRGKLNPPSLRALLYLFERDEALPLIGAG